MAENQNGGAISAGADTDAYVQRRRRLRWEAQRSLHNKKVEAKAVLDKHAHVLARKVGYQEEEVSAAYAAIAASQRELNADRAYTALEALQELADLKDTGDIQFDSGVIHVATGRKYLITHFGENLGFRDKTFMDWFPAFELPPGLAITSVQDVKSLASQLSQRYMYHVETLKGLYYKRMVRRLRGQYDPAELARELTNDKDIAYFTFAASGLRQIAEMAEQGTFTDSLDKETNEVLPLNDEFHMDPALEDVTYHVQNRSIWKLRVNSGRSDTGIYHSADYVVQSTTSRCRAPYIPETQNETTTKFFNKVISPHTQKWVLITLRNAMHRFSIKIMPYHGLNTSMVFPFYAKINDPDGTDLPLEDFRGKKYTYKVHSLEPYAIQGKVNEIDAMYQAVRVAKFVGNNRLNLQDLRIKEHLQELVQYNSRNAVYPHARIFYSKEDKGVGDSSIYFLYYSGRIYGVVTYAPDIPHLWKQYHKQLEFDHPHPWTMPPLPPNPHRHGHNHNHNHNQPAPDEEGGRGEPDGGAGGAQEGGEGGAGGAQGGAQDEQAPAGGRAPEQPPAAAAAGGVPPRYVAPRSGGPARGGKAVQPLATTPEYLLKEGGKGTEIPKVIVVDEIPNRNDGDFAKLEFGLKDAKDMIYENKFEDLELKPYQIVDRWHWGIFKVNQAAGDVRLGTSHHENDRVLITGEEELWFFDKNIQGQPYDPRDGYLNVTITAKKGEGWFARHPFDRVGVQSRGREGPPQNPWRGPPRYGGGPRYGQGGPPTGRWKVSERVPSQYTGNEMDWAWPLSLPYQRDELHGPEYALPEVLRVAGLVNSKSKAVTLDFTLADPKMMIYHSKGQFNLAILPYISAKIGKKFTWKMEKQNADPNADEDYFGRIDNKNQFLTNGQPTRWRMSRYIDGPLINRDGSTAPIVLDITSIGGWVPRTEERVGFHESDDEGERGGGRSDTEALYRLPLQPRRLAARPRPAPWASSTSVDMAGVLASLAEIKRALNAQGMGLRL
jgi:hypothetical protein